MPRKGRDLEILIEKLESLSLPDSAEIKSPDYIKDKITGSIREVDISIKYTLGLTPILIVIECRDRSVSQDDTWVEQLRTKGDKVGADKIIAVSRNGFTAPALKSASFYGSDTRTIDEINLNDITGWFAPQFKGGSQKKLRVNILEALFNKKLENDKSEESYTINTEEKVFYIKEEDTLVGLWDLMNFGLKLYQRDKPLNQDGTKQHIHFLLDFEQFRKTILFKKNEVEKSVKTIEFKLETWFESELLPIRNVFRYSGEEGALMERIEQEIIIGKKKEIIALTRNLKTGKGFISREDTE